MERPENWFATEWTPDRIDEFSRLVYADQYGPVAVRKAFSTVSPDNQKWALDTVAQNRLPLMCADVFTLPVLSAEACRYIIERSNNYEWEENAEEQEAVRMPEAVLSTKDPELFDDIIQAFLQTLAPWCAAIWHKWPRNLSSLQLARYNLAERQKGSLHFDRDSNFTAVISLDPDAFEGGGTYVCDGVFGGVEVPPLKQGHALLFDGRRVLHEGLPVLSGDRRLLVMWATDDAPKDVISTPDQSEVG